MAIIGLKSFGTVKAKDPEGGTRMYSWSDDEDELLSDHDRMREIMSSDSLAYEFCNSRTIDIRAALDKKRKVDFQNPTSRYVVEHLLSAITFCSASSTVKFMLPENVFLELQKADRVYAVMYSAREWQSVSFPIPFRQAINV